MLCHRSPERYRLLLLISGLLCCRQSPALAEDVGLHLSTGDRVSGTVVSRTATHIVISNTWAAELSVPLNQVVSGLGNSTPIEGSLTTIVSEAKSGSEKPAAKPASPWKGEAQAGLDLVFGAKDRQILYGRFKLTYQKPYESDPKKFFRNVFDYTIDYGRTTTRHTQEDGSTYEDTSTTSDRMNASDKTSFDLKDPWYVYNLVGGGYDHVLKINAQYEAGPGVGNHLITTTDFSLNVEGGLNYQAQFRDDDSDVQDVYYRLAEDTTWRLFGKLTLVEKFEFFPRVNFSGYRLRFESTLRYDLWKNLALNLTVLDLYDTDPAETVSHNELQVRSSLGLKF